MTGIVKDILCIFTLVRRNSEENEKFKALLGKSFEYFQPGDSVIKNSALLTEIMLEEYHNKLCALKSLIDSQNGIFSIFSNSKSKMIMGIDAVTSCRDNCVLFIHQKMSRLEEEKERIEKVEQLRSENLIRERELMDRKERENQKDRDVQIELNQTKIKMDLLAHQLKQTEIDAAIAMRREEMEHKKNASITSVDELANKVREIDVNQTPTKVKLMKIYRSPTGKKIHCEAHLGATSMDEVDISTVPESEKCKRCFKR